MKINQVLVESTQATVAFAFGRFNPSHVGHIEVWRTVEDAGANWFIGTNPSTLGPNDPLTFQQKSAWMEEIYPPIAGHIVAEQTVLTLAAYIFKKLRKNERATVAYITDATDWAWSGKLLNQYNGQEGAHGYYKFAQITHVPSPRVSSATALRDAARADDKVAFYHASGTDPKSKVAGKTYFDTVKEACAKYPVPVKKAKKESVEEAFGYNSNKYLDNTPTKAGRDAERAAGIRPNGPQRLFSECADMLHISSNQLVALAKQFPGFPPVKSVGENKRYCDLNLFKKWVITNNIREVIAAKEWNVTEQGVAEYHGNTSSGNKLAEVFNTQPSNTATWARPMGDWSDMDEFNFVASNGVSYQVDFLSPSVGPDELDPYVFFEPDEEISDQAYKSARFVEFEQKSNTQGTTGKQGIEGTGVAAEVFGIVTNAILQYIKKAKPSMLYFQAVESNRQRLYAKMAARIAQTIQWKIKQDGPAHFAIYDPRVIKAEGGSQDVAEAFDKPYRSKTEKSESGSFDVLAKLPDGTNLSIMFNNEGNDEWQVEFYRNNSQEVTGEGDAQRIFATVLNAIQKFIAKHKPAHLTFAASKETDPTIVYEPGEPQPNPASRAKLYDRLVQRYAKAWGYKAFRADNGHIVMYELSRINKQGVAEGETSIRIGDVLHNANQAVNAARQLNAKVVKTVAGYYKVTTLDDPRPAITVNTDYYDQQRKLNQEISNLNNQINKIDSKLNSERFEIFDKFHSLFPNHRPGDEKSGNWLTTMLWKLNQKYYNTPNYVQLKADIKKKQHELKQLINSNKRSVAVRGVAEGMDKTQKAAIKGMHQLSGDEYYGLYQKMKDIAGHDGKKQTAPNGKSDGEIKDKPFAYAYTDVEEKMIKGVDPKAKKITSSKSEEVKESSGQKTIAKTWNQMTSQEKLSGVKGRTVWNEKTQRYYTVFDVPVVQNKKPVEESAPYWTNLPQSMTTEDKIAFFEQYYTKGNLLESNDSSSAEYFKMLADQAINPIDDQQYIVVPLMLVNNQLKLINAKPSRLKFLGQDSEGLVFTGPDGYVTYPPRRFSAIAMTHTFVFDTLSDYDKFRTLVSLRFNTVLPALTEIQAEASLATMRDYFAGDTSARDPLEITKQRLHFSKEPNSKSTRKEFRSQAEYELWLKRNKLRQISSVKEDEEAGEVKKTGQLIPFPQGTTKVSVSDVYDWYKLGQVISDLDDADPAEFGQGAPETVIAFGSEEEEHKLLPLLQRLGLKLKDIDQPVAEAYDAGSLYDQLKKQPIANWTLINKKTL